MERKLIFPEQVLLDWRQGIWLELVAEFMLEFGWKGAMFSFLNGYQARQNIK